MAVKIRMKRIGSKKRPFYRIVVADSRRSRNGRLIEEIGFYNPISEPRQFRIDANKAQDWVKNGAQPTDTVSRLFREYEVLSSEGTISVGEPQVGQKEAKKESALKALEKQQAEVLEAERKAREEEAAAAEAEAAKAAVEAEEAASDEEDAVSEEGEENPETDNEPEEAEEA